MASAETGRIRSEVNRMIKACEIGTTDTVLTKSLIRFGHDAKEALEAIRKIRTLEKGLYLRKIR